MRGAVLTILFFLSWLTLQPAVADEDVTQIRATLLNGQYDQAISAASNIETVDGFVLQAEGISAKILLGTVEDRKKSAKLARKLAEKAIFLDPAHKEARIQYALAYGFQTQATSPFTAWQKKLPKKTRESITILQDYFGDDPRSDALLGAWHLGIVRKAGKKRALDMFEASEADGIASYNAALLKSPNDIIILSNYTAALLAIDVERHIPLARANLERLQAIPPTNAVDKEIRRRMAIMKAHLDDPDHLELLAENLLDGVNEGWE